MNVKPAENVEEEFDTEAFARTIASATWDVKAVNTAVIDLRGRVSYTDFVVVTTGTSDRHVLAIARHVEQAVRDETGISTYGREGLDVGRWALLDFGDAILHVFNGPVRQEYDLERMWSEAPRLELAEKPESLYGHFELERFEDS